MRVLTGTWQRTTIGGVIAAAMLLTAGLGLTVASQSAAAQDNALGGSYVTPFPEGDVYRLRVVGDWLADGMLSALQETKNREARLEINPKRWTLTRVSRPDFAQEITELKADLLTEKAHIAVIMLGLQDGRSLRDGNGRRLSFGSIEWRAEYGRRIEAVMKELKRASIAVYWVGLPIMRRADANEEAQFINEVTRQRAYLSGVRYIDIYAALADEQGGFSPYGPDMTGKIGLLRGRDGVSFTYAGSQKVAHFVERELKRDLAQAKAERAVPLAGSESEQKRVASVDAAGNPKRADWRTSIAAARAKAAGGTGGGAAGLFDQRAGEQPAENTRINLKTPGPGGREQILSLDIVRPAIPASIVSLVTRKQSADKATPLGDTLVDQIAGGVNIMSTVTPAAGTGAAPGARLSPAQAPYFRVLVKGERTQPRPGRADDFSWPRPPPPVIALPGVPAGSSRDAASGGRVPLPAASPFRPRA
ncbi:MAG: DUF459 domain-containing protein [Hyphomicrobiaceae bacterium]|nr:DUF459 domain-containing protein [Hyphomicrobiaceae bacterium]